MDDTLWLAIKLVKSGNNNQMLARWLANALWKWETLEKASPRIHLAQASKRAATA